MAIKLSDNTHNGAKIRVVGVGGGGGNVLNSMLDKGIEGVEFIAVNTDTQALQMNNAEKRYRSEEVLQKDSVQE
ncbi:MAG: hypothetical protein R3A12_06830 [Ignavibacteria bacterium]